jgi:hypothetical protein
VNGPATIAHTLGPYGCPTVGSHRIKPRNTQTRNKLFWDVGGTHPSRCRGLRMAPPPSRGAPSSRRCIAPKSLSMRLVRYRKNIQDVAEKAQFRYKRPILKYVRCMKAVWSGCEGWRTRVDVEDCERACNHRAHPRSLRMSYRRVLSNKPPKLRNKLFWDVGGTHPSRCRGL